MQDEQQMQHGGGECAVEVMAGTICDQDWVMQGPVEWINLAFNWNWEGGEVAKSSECRIRG